MVHKINVNNYKTEIPNEIATATYKELQALCVRYGLRAKGTRDVLEQRLSAHWDSPPEAAGVGGSSVSQPSYVSSAESLNESFKSVDTSVALSVATSAAAIVGRGMQMSYMLITAFGGLFVALLGLCACVHHASDRLRAVWTNLDLTDLWKRLSSASAWRRLGGWMYVSIRFWGANQKDVDEFMLQCLISDADVEEHPLCAYEHVWSACVFPRMRPVLLVLPVLPVLLVLAWALFSGAGPSQQVAPIMRADAPLADASADRRTCQVVSPGTTLYTSKTAQLPHGEEYHKWTFAAHFTRVRHLLPTVVTNASSCVSALDTEFYRQLGHTMWTDHRECMVCTSEDASPTCGPHSLPLDCRLILQTEIAGALKFALSTRSVSVACDTPFKEGCKKNKTDTCHRLVLGDSLVSADYYSVVAKQINASYIDPQRPAHSAEYLITEKVQCLDGSLVSVGGIQGHNVTVGWAKY